MSERERFEAWVFADSEMKAWANPKANYRRPDGHYFYAHAEIAWIAWQAARSGQAASGSSQGARSDEAVKRFGIKPWSTLAQLKDDEDLELYVQARIEAEGVGQPEAPTTAPLSAQQLDALIEGHVGGAELADGEYSSMVLFAAAVERAHGIGPAHPPARSGAGSDDARDAERWRWIEARFRVFSLDISGRHSYCATGEIGRIRGSSLGAAVDAAIAASKPNAASPQPDRSEP